MLSQAVFEIIFLINITKYQSHKKKSCSDIIMYCKRVFFPRLEFLEDFDFGKMRNFDKYAWIYGIIILSCQQAIL